MVQKRLQDKIIAGTNDPAGCIRSGIMNKGGKGRQEVIPQSDATVPAPADLRRIEWKSHGKF